MIQYWLLAIAAFVYILHLIFNYNGNVRLLRKIPGPKPKFLFGDALEIFLSPEELFNLPRKRNKLYGEIYSSWAFLLNFVTISNPDDIEVVTSTMKHHEKSYIYNILKKWLKEGLLLSSGSKWQNRRKILTPTFHFNILKQFCTTFEENSQRLVKELTEANGEAIDISTVLSDYTLHGVCETAMGTRLDLNSSKYYKRNLRELIQFLVERFSKAFLHNNFTFYFSPLARKTNKALKDVHAFTQNVINERREHFKKHVSKLNLSDNLNNDDNDIYFKGKKRGIAMLDLLLEAEHKGEIDNDGIQEEVDTFTFEGHDTTATGLIYFLMLLANHEKIQNNIVIELREVFGDSDRLATIEELSSLKYLDRCIKESMRLYPPVPFISRKLSETVKLRNYTIPSGTTCLIFPFDVHRREDLFKDPLVYDPDRFLPENCIGRHAYAYIPFSAGPRNCIGQKFAMLEMKSCAAALLRQFRLLPVTRPEDLRFTADVVLRNADPVYVKFIPRNKF